MGKTIVVCSMEDCPDHAENGECKRDIIYLDESGICEENRDFARIWKKGAEMEELIEKLRTYAAAYRKPPYGREVEGTPELLEEAVLSIQETTKDMSLIITMQSRIENDSK